MDIELPGTASLLMKSDLQYFLQYLQISSNPNESDMNPHICTLNVSTFGRKSKMALLFSHDDLHQADKVDGYFYYKSHSEESLAILSQKMKFNLHFRIYLLCHNLFDLMDEYEKIVQLGIDVSRITFIFSKFDQSLCFYPENKLKKLIEDVKYNEIYFANPYKQQKPIKDSIVSRSNFTFYFLIRFFRFVLTPVKNCQIILHKLNLNWFLRLKEFFDFIFNFYFVVASGMGVAKGVCLFVLNKLRHILMMCGFKSFGIVVDNYQLLRVFFIRAFFKVRHVVLMAGYKPYGIVVDIYYGVRVFFIRAFFKVRHVVLMAGYKPYGIGVDIYYGVRVVLIRAFFKVRHVVLMAGYKPYGIGVDIYYGVRVFFIRAFFKVRHVVLMSAYSSYGFVVDVFQFLRLILIRGYFKIRHIFLMTYFKVYGLVVDLYYEIYGLTNNGYHRLRVLIIRSYFQIRHYLVMSINQTGWFIMHSFAFLIAQFRRLSVILFPFFKVYWFVSYQYKKRLKKVL